MDNNFRTGNLKSNYDTKLDELYVNYQAFNLIEKQRHHF